MSEISVVLPVLAPTPFLRSLTEHCIKTLRVHADKPFELIVVEAGEKNFDVYCEHWSEYDHGLEMKIDKYLNFNPPIGGVREINAGIRAASGDFVAVVGNDVVAPLHWDTELVLPFERYKDCGISCLAAAEPGVFIGPRSAIDLIVEGMFSPFSMWKKGWEYDESYLRIYQDSDLVLRMYEAGLRAYRNCRAICLHLGGATNNSASAEHTAEHNRQVGKDETFFYNRWQGCPHWMYGMIRWGQITYGREHEAWLQPIHRHG